MPPTKVQSKSATFPPENGGRGKKIALLVGLFAVAAFVFLRKATPPPVEIDSKRAGDIKGVFAGGPTSTRVNSKPAESRGAFAADEFMQVAGKSGSVVLVTETPGAMMLSTSDMGRFLGMIAAEVEAFKDRLEDGGKFTFLPELKLPRGDGATRTSWPSGAFTQLLQRTPPQAHIVAFCQFPAQLTDGEKTLLRSRPGKVMIAAGLESEMRPLVQEKLISLAVATRTPIPAPPTTNPESPTQWVRRVHVVLK